MARSVGINLQWSATTLIYYLFNKLKKSSCFIGICKISKSDVKKKWKLARFVNEAHHYLK